MAEPQDVVVIFVHGINVNSQDFYVGMRDRLLAALPKKARECAIFRAAFWADIVRGRQQEYTLYARERSCFSDTALHKLVIEGLGDAAAYQKTPWRQNSAYYEIQARMRRAIHDVCLGPNDRRPLVFIGHSLGCHIISSYCWDIHTLKAPGAEQKMAEWDQATRRNESDTGLNAPFERLETLAGLVTMGSNQPLFTFTFGPQFVHPITRSLNPGTLDPAFPGAALGEALKARAKWLNYYSRNDPLGYPLKPLNDAYDEEERISDIHARSEGLWRSLLPERLRPFAALKAHTGYWTNPKVVRGAAKLIEDIIYAEQRAARHGGAPKASAAAGP